MNNLEIISGVAVANHITEELHTFSHWQSLGFKVKKGEHGIQTRLWKYNPKVAEKTKSDENDSVEDKKLRSRGFYLAKSFLFSFSQVERKEDDDTSES